MRRLLVGAAAALLAIAPAALAGQRGDEVRFATFNASLNRAKRGAPGGAALAPGGGRRLPAPDPQRGRGGPAGAAGRGADQRGRLLAAGGPALPRQLPGGVADGAAPIDYPYAYIAPSNTGVPTGKDLDNDGTVGAPGTPAYGNDAFGFGAFPGQFGMVVYSRYPIDSKRVRTFQKFLWKDMPGGNGIPTPFYSPDEVDVLRLSSKSHWDVPIRIAGRRVVHFLVSHPTPPVFDGAEDRNGRRNFDEIRFWADYISPKRSLYIYDDEGAKGGLGRGELFVIAGDQNSDPLDGDSIPGAAQQFLEHPLINAKGAPTSEGAVEATALQGGANATHKSDPRFDTADFADTTPGNLRADYVLPRRNMRVVDGAVFWPLQKSPLFRLTGVFDSATWGPVAGFPTSDHRLVWIDVDLPKGRDDHKGKGHKDRGHHKGR